MLSNKKVITMITPPKFNSLQIESDLNQKKKNSVYDKRAYFLNGVNSTYLRLFNVVVYIILIDTQYH